MSPNGDDHAASRRPRPAAARGGGPIVRLLLVTALMAPAAADAQQDGLAAAIERAKRATVAILAPDAAEAAPAPPTNAHFSVRGTAVHVRDGYLVTARHAVQRQEGSQSVIARHIRVLTDEFHELPATLTGFNEFLDLAVYRITVEDVASLLTAVPFGGGEPAEGEEVFTVGYPLGWGPTVGFGRVGNSQTFLATLESRLLQLDLAACSGNSGGGLFNARGQIVGVVHAIIQTGGLHVERQCSRLAFAVPGPLARRMVERLIAGEAPGFPRLGVQLTTIKLGTQWRVGVGDVSGPAKDGGLREGDVLLSINGTEITSAAQLKSYLLEETRPGQRVEVRVRRDGIEQVFPVTLGTASP